MEILLDFSYDYDLTMPITRVVKVPDSGPLISIGEFKYQERIKNASAEVGSLETGYLTSLTDLTELTENMSSEDQKWFENLIVDGNKEYLHRPDRLNSRGNKRPTIYLNLGIDSSKKPPRGEELLLMWIKERGEWIGIEESSHLEGLTFGDYKDYDGPYALDEKYALKILEAYGIPEETLPLEKVLHTDPSELEKIASKRK